MYVSFWPRTLAALTTRIELLECVGYEDGIGLDAVAKRETASPAGSRSLVFHSLLLC